MEARAGEESVRAPARATMPQLLQAALRRHGGAAAIAWREGAWLERSSAELAEHVELVARGLAALGIEPGDRVAILSGTREEWTWFDYGALCAGAVVVPIYHTNSPSECAHVLRDADVRLCLCEDAEQLAKVDGLHGLLPQLEHLLTIEPAGVATLAELEQHGERARGSDPGGFAARCEAVAPDDVCTIVYTSGTTGPPRGCVVLHRNFQAMVEMVPESILVPGDLVYLYLPLAHSFARLVQFATLRFGATLAYARGTSQIPEDLQALHPTVLPSVPRVFEKVHHAILTRVEESSAVRRRLFAWAVGLGRRRITAQLAGRTLDAPARAQLALADRLVLGKIRARLGGRVRVCVSGGAPVSPEILELFAACGMTVLEGYGLTESSTAAAINTEDALRFGTVGRPLAGVEARIADDGEILLRGPNIFAGYWRDPAATADVLRDGWLHTGDVGELEDGFIRITDRKKDIIITAGGKNVAPGNLEFALKESPYIAEACVVGDRRPYVAALITLDRDTVAYHAEHHGIHAHADELRHHPGIRALVQQAVDRVNANLSRSAQIKRFAILDAEFSQASGELTPTLKLKRGVVLDRYRDEVERLYR